MMKVEDWIGNSPFLTRFARAVPKKLRGSFKVKSAERVFSEVFQGNLWGDPESLSGPGSNLLETRTIRRDLPRLFAKYGVRSILDVPCGDFNWMKEMDLAGVNYAEYLITTSPCRVWNQNVATGGWRPLNFQVGPFSFPEPLEIIWEDQPLTKFSDKSIGLWAIRDISRCLPF